MSAGLGGYLAEHLRRHSPSASADETHFRDTVHGFLAWALATLFTAMLLTSAVSGIARVGLNAVSTHANSTSVMSGPGGLGGLDRGNALAACRTWPMGSLIDGLLRPVAGASAPNPQAAAAEQKQEIARIFLNSLPTGGALSPEDSGYVARIVAQNAGLAPADALARVTTTWSRLEDKARELNDAARAEADAARKATIHVALWLFVSLLLGAFTASLMATIGGPLSRSPSIYPHHHRLSDRSTSPPSERLSSP